MEHLVKQGFLTSGVAWLGVVWRGYARLGTKDAEHDGMMTPAKKFHVEQSGHTQKYSQGAVGKRGTDRVSTAPVVSKPESGIVIESPQRERELPQLPLITDANRVQVHLTPEAKLWFSLIATIEVRPVSQQGRKVLMEFIEGWKAEHPELVAKYEAAIRAGALDLERGAA